jgi:hypothetical protein
VLPDFLMGLFAWKGAFFNRKTTGQGIFYCPELYVAVVMGKAIKKREM